ncbi:hypothetical protein [Photorhabdus cinerea]
MKIYWLYSVKNYHLMSVKKVLEITIKDFYLVGDAFVSEEELSRLIC